MAERKLLLVDDNAAFRRLLAEFLRRRGYDVGEAEDGNDALRAIEAARPGLVVSDCQMPGMTGPQLVHELSQSDPNLPVILISGEYESEQSGAIAFFAKTNSMEYLADRVDQIWKSIAGES
ncbi:MAG: response regulator [Planctomycetota bacterium]